MQDVIDKMNTFRALKDQISPRFPVPDVVEIKGSKGSKILTIFAIIHGDEVGGLAAVTRYLSENLKSAPLTIRLALGNVPACLKKLRYLGSDLNRSFGRSQPPETNEHLRARELEALLDETDFLLDIHQTREPVDTPFFIFPYLKRSLEFAESLKLGFPIVTHWGAPFSKDGLSTDGYLVSKNLGCGITLEIGQSGMEPHKVNVALKAIRRAVEWISAGAEPVSSSDITRLYTWAEVIPYPEDARFLMTPGLKNFQHLPSGASLNANPEGPDIITAHSGPVLFPFYLRPTDPQKPAELCRILRPFDRSELLHLS